MLVQSLPKSASANEIFRVYEIKILCLTIPCTSIIYIHVYIYIYINTVNGQFAGFRAPLLVTDIAVHHSGQ